MNNIQLNSNMFSNSGSNNSSTGLYGMIGEYNNIRSGAYFKALKSYYGTNGASKTSAASKTSSSGNTDTDLAKKLRELESSTASKAYTNVKSEATDLQKSAAALTETGKDSLFVEKEKTVKDEKTGEETTVKEIDRDGINSALKKFVSDYNDTLKAADESGSANIKRNAGYMTNQTKIFGRALEEVGITINKDNTLSIDEEKLSSAKMDNLKTLFNGKNSFANFVSQKADMVSSAAEKEATKANSLYNNAGAYQNNNGYFDSSNWYL